MGSCPVGAIVEAAENAEGGEAKVVDIPAKPAEEESDMAA
jgi:hypothetical protein